MGKRLIIKTALICIGIFLIINSAVIAYIFSKYPIDHEKHISVVVAALDIEEGQVIQDKDLKTKEIQLSASNTLFTTDKSQISGRKATTRIQRNEYIRTNTLIEKSDWFQDDDRIIILPVSIEERMANLITKGSYIDIRLKKNSSFTIETILSKVKVEDILDETGTSLKSKTGVNSKTAYMKLVLDNDERQKIYTAAETGKMIYELYCEDTQKP